MTKAPYSDVLEWMRKTGFPFELSIGRRFQAAGWHVNYSRWYRDNTTGKNRELDVEALVGGVHLNQASTFFSLCIECKSSKDKPWVALSSGLTLGENALLSFAIGPMTRTTLIGALTEGLTLPTLLDSSVPRVGGLIQAHSGKDAGAPSTPYAALLQARSAALALDAEYETTAIAVAPKIATAAVFLPMVVIDGTLLQYSVGGDLSESLGEIDAAAVSVPGDAENEAAVVPVVTRSFAEKLCHDSYLSAHSFCVAMLPHASKVVGALRIGSLTDGG